MQPLALFLFALALSLPLAAEAQEEPSAPPAVSLEGALTADELELRAIDTQAAWATGLYVTSAIAAVTSVPFVFGALFTGGSELFQWDSSGPTTSFLIAVGLGSIAIVTLGIAIGLDVDSGARRQRLSARRATLRICPSVFGLSLAGTF